MGGEKNYMVVNMKIAQIICTFPPYRGGIGNVAYYYSLELAYLGHEVTVFTPCYQKENKELKDVKVKRLKPVLKYGNAAFLPQLFWQLKNFDVIHFHYPFFGSDWIIYLIKIFRQIRFLKLFMVVLG